MSRHHQDDPVTVPILDPDFEALADFDPGIGSGPVDLTEIRTAMASLTPPPEPLPGTVASTVVVRDMPRLTADMFSPAQGGERGCLVWFHGGGYLIGSPSMDAERMQRWTRNLGCVTISLDYRLAPEHPFPAAHDDAVAALKWVLDHAPSLGVDPDRIVVGGASAGAGLAASLALAARDLGIPLAGQLLFYPMLDDRQRTASSRWPAPIWSHAANHYAWRAYLGDRPVEDIPPYAAPSRATDLVGVTRALLIVGGADGFLDEDSAYAAALQHAGVPTDLRVVAGAPHGFDLLAPEAVVSREVLATAEAWLLARLLGETEPRSTD